MRAPVVYCPRTITENPSTLKDVAKRLSLTQTPQYIVRDYKVENTIDLLVNATQAN